MDKMDIDSTLARPTHTTTTTTATSSSTSTIVTTTPDDARTWTVERVGTWASAELNAALIPKTTIDHVVNQLAVNVVTGPSLIDMANLEEEKLVLRLERWGIPGGPATKLAAAIIQHCKGPSTAAPPQDLGDLKQEVNFLKMELTKIKIRSLLFLSTSYSDFMSAITVVPVDFADWKLGNKQIVVESTTFSNPPLKNSSKKRRRNSNSTSKKLGSVEQEQEQEQEHEHEQEQEEGGEVTERVLQDYFMQQIQTLLKEVHSHLQVFDTSAKRMNNKEKNFTVDKERKRCDITFVTSTTMTTATSTTTTTMTTTANTGVVPAYPTPAPASSSNDLMTAKHILLGEIKRFKLIKFEPSEQGQILNYCVRTLIKQPFRKFIYGFLTDCSHIQFFRVSQEAPHQELGTYRFEASAFVNFATKGLHQLITIITATNESLGWNPPEFSSNNTRVELMEHIGSGRTSLVYSGKINTTIVAVKHFHPEFKELCKKEVTILQQFVALVPAVPKVCSYDYDLGYFVMTPVGKKKFELTKHHIDELANLLQTVHKAGWVHRDIRPSNLIKEMGKNFILLIDWGFAVQAHQTIESFEGTIHYASDRILDANSLFYLEYFPADDLYSLARSLYALQYTDIRTELNHLDGSSKRGRGQIKQMWAKVTAQDKLWQDVLDACKQEQYDKLNNALKKMLFCS